MQYHTIDLGEIRASLGHHYDGREADNYTGRCVCGENVTQMVSECPYCGIAIVWIRSKAWRSLYGPPDAALKRLRVYPPTDELGAWLMQRARVEGFANQGELDDWNAALADLDERAFRSGIDRWISGQRAKGRRSSGRTLVGFAINWARKIHRESDRVVRRRKPKRIKAW